MPDPDRPIDRLAGTLVAALRRLGEAGEPEAASRLAAQAWVALRHDEPRLAERINGVMHRLATLEAAASRATGAATPAADRGPGPERTA